MKFTCDSCSAQYMISDEKVGPSGVKVRCKKCGSVVLVRRASEVPAETPAAARTNGAGASGNGAAELDAELGQAFDSAFGDPPAQSAPAEGSEPPKTQAMSEEDEAHDAASTSSPAPTEWYVAIGQAQVGPLPLAEVKRKWEAGDVGPDSLVWRPGMTDWQPLSSVAELAGYLAPVPRARPQPRAEAFTRSEPQAAHDRPAATPTPAADVTWKPVGAAALATLASEEIAARAPGRRSPAAGSPNGVKSLVDGLPDGGGVDPTGAIPLSIKGLDTTAERKAEESKVEERRIEERKIERRPARSTVASRAEEFRHRRSVTRAVVVTVVVVLALVAGAAAYVFSQMNKLAAAPPSGAVATAPSPAPPAAPAAAAPPAAAPAAPATPSAPAAPAPPAGAAAAPAAPAEQPAAAAAPQPAEKAAPAPTRVAKAEGTRRRKDGRREVQTARAEPPAARGEPAPAPAPRPAAGRKKDSLLDFDSSDAALNDALHGGGGSSGRSVYVPPARAGAGALPDKLSPAQINESVAGRIDALRKCVSDQKARDPSASGILRLRWIIGGDGNVRDVKTLTSEFASSPFAQCITGVVKTIKFPRSTTTGQEVTFPFSF